MNPPVHWLHHKVFLLLFFSLIINIFALDLWLAVNFKPTNKKQVAQQSTITPRPFPTGLKNQSCPLSCLSAISEATASLKLTTRMESPPLPTAPPPNIIVSQKEINAVKEFFIPLGTGTSTAQDWTDITGVKAEIDNTKYGKIQKVLFEASVHVPDANEIIEVRLYNESDKYIVWNSELTFPSGTSQNFRISEISLGQGAKTYKVQMKTQLKFPAVLDQARIHITTY